MDIRNIYGSRAGCTGVSVNFDHVRKKNFLGGEVPGEQLAPVVGGTHFRGLLKDAG
jgi:hypothetical protein